MERSKITSFILILASSFLILLVYLFPVSGKKDLTNKVNSFETLSKVGINKPVEVVLIGDVMLGRSVMDKAIKVGNFNYPFEKVADYLNRADLVFANLENPIVKDCPRTNSGFKFCTNYDVAGGLTFAGIDVVNLANNHSSNYGKEGLTETKKYLTQKMISFTGDNNLVIKKVNGVKYGFLGFDYVTTNNLEGDLELIKVADQQVDVLIVSAHWGEEYRSKANLNQKNIATKMVKNGADVIVGHHPHWVQNSEVIEEKVVYYSLGNFIFDQPWSEETKKGLMVKLTFDGSTLVKKEEMPIYMYSLGQPQISKNN